MRRASLEMSGELTEGPGDQMWMWPVSTFQGRIQYFKIAKKKGGGGGDGNWY